ncbi:uncharacterized protein LTR77_010019 [Saxophila tyrrhenica]|uniref:Uncharacterized protein n=1 Tax=Saxophila tyrrhenica TaxID=1690608 RepID=A0AAV9NWM1_9PEZI|nr:hypothetical protein LTR77_010019 [Saxophila tyrrhenica]
MTVMHKQQEQQALAAGQIPDDLGLLPGTFIMPYGKNRPSWTSETRKRWEMEKERWKTRFMDFYALFSLRYWVIRPRPRLEPLKLPRLARTLHQTMYSHFAAGNLDAIAPKLCPGLLSSLRNRIASRPPKTFQRWTLHRYLSSPSLVSMRTTLIPGTKDETRWTRNGVVQAVVRIHSVQSLQSVKRVNYTEKGVKLSKDVMVDSTGREIAGAPAPEVEAASERRAKEVVEYFVLQSVIRRSKLAPWMVWGTAEEMTVQKLEALDGKRRPKKERGRQEDEERKGLLG